MHKKIRRNEKCWCNSGKKYKHCHLDRHLQPRLSREENIKGLRKAFDQKFCLHPDTSNCSPRIIKAHSIQEKLLYKIATKGKIYTSEHDYGALLKSGSWTTRPIGLNEASTFGGFCEYHDNATFAPIEKVNYQINDETAFLHSYRSLCRELYMSKCAIDALWLNRETDRGRSLEVQIMLQKQNDQREAALKNLRNGLEEYKKRYDEILLLKEFHRCKSYQIETDKVPPFVVGGVTAAISDFNGKLLQRPRSDRILPPLTLNVLPYGNDHGLISFAWVDKCIANELLSQSLDRVPREQLSEVIRSYALEFFENLYFSPEWWEGLPESYKKHVEKRVMQRTFGHDYSCMLRDEYTLCDFKAIKIITNLTFVEVQCTTCREWFSSGIRFGNAQVFDTATLIGNRTRCPNGHTTGINKENMRVRFQNGGFVGIETTSERVL